MDWWSFVGCDLRYPGLGQVRLNDQQIYGWWSSLGCDSFRDETYRDVKTSGNNVQGRIVGGQNVQGRIVRGQNVQGRNVRGHIIPVRRSGMYG